MKDITMIDSREANAVLSDIENLGRQVRQSLMYQRASSMLTLWGIVTFAGYVMSFFFPSTARIVWLAVFAIGMSGSIALGRMSRKREGVSTFDWRMTCAFMAFVAFGCLWSVGIGQFTPRQLGTFWTTYFMLPYVLVGLWFGRAFVAIGSAVIALTLSVYFFADDWFNLCMAFINGGGLVLGGLWMRRGL
jgi:hypothetical protein